MGSGTGRTATLGARRRSVSALRSSFANAVAGGRFAGSIATAWAIAASRRFGRSGRSSSSGGAPRSIVAAICGNGTPQNGCLPASASQSRIPTPQTSLAGRASSPSSRSGEM